MRNNSFYSISKCASVDYGPYREIRPKKRICEYCKQEFVFYTGQILYTYDKKCFCCYNHRSFWKKENLNK